MLRQTMLIVIGPAELLIAFVLKLLAAVQLMLRFVA